MHERQPTQKRRSSGKLGRAAARNVGGVRVGRKLTVGALMYLEDKLGPGFKTEGLNTARMRDVHVYLTAMVLSANPEMSEADAEAKARTIATDDLTSILGELEGTGDENPPKVAGNLQE